MKSIIIIAVMITVTVLLAINVMDVYNELQVVGARLAEVNEQLANL